MFFRRSFQFERFPYNIKVFQLFQFFQMKIKTSRPSVIYEDRTQIKSGEKKLKSSKKLNELSRHQNNISSCSMLPSTFRNNYTTQQQAGNLRTQDVEYLQMGYFTQKYLLRDDEQENLKQQMKMVLNRKKNQIQSLRIYRDQLKFISKNNSYSEPIKISVQTLKQKAEIEQKLSYYKAMLDKQVKNADKQLQMLTEYQKFIEHSMDMSKSYLNHDILDISKQEEVMLKNLQTQTQLLIRELADQQKKNSREIKQIQDQILEYRIVIKEKEDHLRNLKAKICTLYIKLHSRNKSRTNSKSKDRSMSLSIRKFNILNHNSIKEAYIGNNTFKSYSKQIIQKVTSQEQLIKIKFFSFQSSAQNTDSNSKNKQQLFFQCFYKGREGQIHDFRNPQPSIDNDVTRDKLSESSEKFEEVYVKYLFSMKFFYKSKIVGVECRIKTDKGNKHIQIGNCDPHIEHELLTLVNKKIITLGSFWHGKEMIGVSVWYSQRQKSVQENKQQDKKTKQKQSYDEYYS